MFNNCCITTCSSRRQDISLHVFPKNEIGRQKWLQHINCERLRSLSFQELRKQFVCFKHFEKRFHSNSRNKIRLRSDAYPTLFSDHEIASGIPDRTTIDLSKIVSATIDHDDYSRKRRHVDHTYYKSEETQKRTKYYDDSKYYNDSKYDDDIGIEMDVTSTQGPEDMPSTSDNRSDATEMTSTILEGLLSHSCTYAEWVVRIILRKNSCKSCEVSLTSTKSNISKDSIDNWIILQEFITKKQRKSTHPSVYAVRTFKFIVKEANKYLEKHGYQENVIKNIKTLIRSMCSFGFINCELHKDAVTESFLNCTLYLTVLSWCNEINKTI